MALGRRYRFCNTKATLTIFPGLNPCISRKVMGMLFYFRFQGNERGAAQWLHDIKNKGGFSLKGSMGVWDMEEGWQQGTGFPLNVWYQLRMYGETEWEDPVKLLRALQSRHAGVQQIFQCLGVDVLSRLTEFDTKVYELHPPAQLSLTVGTGFSTRGVQDVYESHLLFSRSLDWVKVRPWGRGHGIHVEANPFDTQAEAELFFFLIRDLARMVPLSADRLGLRSVRAWLPLDACHNLCHQLHIHDLYIKSVSTI